MIPRLFWLIAHLQLAGSEPNMTSFEMCWCDTLKSSIVWPQSDRDERTVQEHGSSDR